MKHNKKKMKVQGATPQEEQSLAWKNKSFSSPFIKERKQAGSSED